ncbi:Uncharacterised protein [Vibrio cholerae]|nr:Uncharacterised protein [Vibrio cholerae]CSI11311.1 Uncharacterised protein [Vibrio cholerae]
MHTEDLTEHDKDLHQKLGDHAHRHTDHNLFEGDHESL